MKKITPLLMYGMLFLMLSSYCLFAQTIVLKGVVMDELHQPLPGASIMEKGTSNGVISDSYGAFSIGVSSSEATLVFSSLGFVSKEVALQDGETEINIVLSTTQDQLSEVVVIGYGTKKRTDVTTSVASIGGRVIENEATANAAEAITGKLAGVQIRQTTGAPGSNINIRVRGASSISAGSEPLYVIDGVPISGVAFSMASITNARNGYGEQPISPLASIDISDIASIEVLKDAASAAIYGSRGSNGVILITTKKGISGQTQVSLNTRVGFSSILNKVDVLDAYDYAKVHRDAKNTAYLENVPGANANDDNSTRVSKAEVAGVDNPTRYQIPKELQPYLDGKTGLTNTDWQDEIFRNAIQQDYTLSIRGGGQKGRYFASLNYLKQEGVVIQSNLERFAARLNVEGAVSKNVKYGVNFNPSRLQYRDVSSNGPTWNEGVIASALTQAPVLPVKNDDGSYHIGLLDWASATSFNPFIPSRNVSSEFVANPVAIANEVKDKRYVNRIIANSFLDFGIIDGLHYRASLGTELNDVRRDFYRPQSLVTLPWIRNNFNGTVDAASSSGNTFNWITEHTLNYTKTLGNHDIAVLAGYTAQEENIKSSTGTGIGFSNDLVHTINAATTTRASTTEEQWSLLSYLFRVQYSFKSKYLLSVAVRRDGSSRFGEGNKWGNFPSVSGGWRISEEDFFPNLGINELKLRSSYGVTGNFQIPNYGSIATVTPSKYASQSGDAINGLVQGTPANKNLSWEQTKSFDVGIDMGFLNNTITLEVDYYQKDTDGLLLNVNVSRTSGYQTQLQNVGGVRNSGYELSLGFQKEIGEVSFKISGNLTSNKNEVTALGSDGSPIFGNSGRGQAFIAKVGEPIGSYYGYVVEGVYNSQKEIDEHLHAENTNNAKPGDFRFKDLNGDGKITADDDREILGSYFPDFYYGMSFSVNYKGFDLSAALQGVQGNEVLNTLRNYTAIPTGGLNILSSVSKDRWVSGSNLGNGAPRANFLTTGNNSAISSYYVEDGSYLKVQNVTLGYKIPRNIADKMQIQGLRVYASIQNPFLFTNYSGYNPEVSANPTNQLAQGEDFGTYPLARTYSMGLNINF